jgi:hypothetical protein
MGEATERSAPAATLSDGPADAPATPKGKPVPLRRARGGFSLLPSKALIERPHDDGRFPPLKPRFCFEGARFILSNLSLASLGAAASASYAYGCERRLLSLLTQQVGDQASTTAAASIISA